MDDERIDSVQKPMSLDLKYSNNLLIDRALIKSPEEISTNNNSNAGTSESISDQTSIEVTSVTDSLKNITEFSGSATTTSYVSDEKDDKTDEATSLLADVSLGNGSAAVSVSDTDQPCAMYGQMITNEDETYELLSDAASWESSFPKDILDDYEQQCSSPQSESGDEDLPPGWRKITDNSGMYYWNKETGKTLKEHPNHTTHIDQSDHDSMTTVDEKTKHHPEESKNASPNTNKHRWSGNSRDGHMFLVRSLGWLPVEHENLKPGVSSAAVNACIRLLSNNRSQIMDGVGVWGEGKDLMLLLNTDHLRIVDTLENTVLQSQLIKHIRVWGVGRDSAHDFAYVVRDPTTRMYKCHVLRCDAPAKAIAKQLHTICSALVKQRRHPNPHKGEDKNTDEIPALSAETCQTFAAKYIGGTTVSKPTGIDIVKQAMHKLMEEVSVGKEVKVSVSPSALIIVETNGNELVNCRMRCLSFMGVGEDIKLFGFINVLAGEATCHVLQCEPNAAKLALAVQESCMLRYQKAIDSKQPALSQTEPVQHKSLKNKVIRLFTGWRHSSS